MMCSTDGGRSWHESQVMESMRELDRVNDLQQYHDRLIIYTESDIYTVSKAELIAQSTTAIRYITSDTATAPTYDLQGRRLEELRHGIFIKSGRKIVR